MAEQTAEELLCVLFSPVYKSNIVKNSNSVESKTTSCSYPAGPGFLRRVGLSSTLRLGCCFVSHPKGTVLTLPHCRGLLWRAWGLLLPETRSLYSPPSSGPFGSLHAARPQPAR